MSSDKNMRLPLDARCLDEELFESDPISTEGSLLRPNEGLCLQGFHRILVSLRCVKHLTPKVYMMSTRTNSYGDPQTRTRILEIAWGLVSERGSRLKLSEVAERAAVSRQAIYLHFGDRNGLLLALVDYMDKTLELGESLAHVHAAPTGAELLERAMRLNTEFWTAVFPVAQVLDAAQYDDQALGAAWRDRLKFRQLTFGSMIRQLADNGELSDVWTVEDASDMLYAVAHFDTWREFTRQLGWSDDHYVNATTTLLSRALLAG